jgi:hypothetical protein
MKFSTVILTAAAAIILAACGKQEVSFNSLEEAKGTARENAMFNAQRYRQENVLYKGWDIIGRGDSTQDNACPQGDGWATMEFVSPPKDKRVKVKCSTVSGNTGCLEDADFKSKPFAADDGHCQATTKVPYPLPKIAK